MSKDRVLRLENKIREDLRFLEDAVVAVYAAFVPAATIAGVLEFLLERRLLYFHLQILRPLDHRVSHWIRVDCIFLLARCAVDD